MGRRDRLATNKHRKMPSSIEILAQTAINKLCQEAQREAVRACAEHYGFNCDEACQRLGLGEETDMIAELLNKRGGRETPSESSAIERKHASRLTDEERTEAARTKKEQKAAEKARKTAEKTAKAAEKALAKAVKQAEKIEKGTKKNKRAPSAYLLF